jgi:hypothetical protein
MMRKVTAMELLNLLEGIVGDDFLEDIGMHVVGDGANPTKYERQAYEKLSKAYRIVHSLNKSHGCHHVHRNWRKEVFKMLQSGGGETRG